MWQVIRAIISLFMSIELLFGTLFSGGGFSSVKMPEEQTGEYTAYVNPFIGTGGTPWAAGMLSPAATVPFGMVRLGPDTSAVNGIFLFKTNTSGYYYEHRHILGFSYSRLSGTGIMDYGMFRVTPYTSISKPKAIAFSHKNETASPGYYAVYLPAAAAMCEMTATEHTGYQRYTFNTSRDAKLCIDAASFIGDGSTRDSVMKYDSETGVITGETTVLGGFSSRFDGMKAYYYAETDASPASTEIINDGEALVLNFGNISGRAVTLRAGISFVSAENAKQNLSAEAGDMSFDEVRRAADSQWNDRLSSIRITAGETEKEIFYTSLYHTMIMPTDFTDYNGEYVGFDKQVHVADGYTYRTDMSLWDTVRDVNALYTLIADDVQKDCVASVLDMADRGGVLPRWPMGEGYTGSMLGCPANIMLAESYLKGYDFDLEKAYDYMVKSAETFNNKENREYAAYYNELGYIPDDLVRSEYHGTSVSRTLEYSWADSVIAMLAGVLGKDEDAAKYSARAMNYKNVWDSETKYFRTRNSDGSWGVLKPNMTAFYDEVLGFDYSKAYTEGSARQWRFSALGDIEGMIDLFGSDEYFVSELNDFMEDASRNRAAFNPGAGYWIGNQHDIHTPYLFDYAGRPDLTQKWVRWTLENRFSTDVNGLDGNDDGGTLSAWYVFSSLGFYPIAGTAEYRLGSPCIESAEMTLTGGSTLKITVNNQGENNIYVQSVTLNGNVIEGTALTHQMLLDGGELVFNMTDEVKQ